ncbi:MAG: redoxin domain-containing protein [Rhodospirillaceae bacterium]|nr:redoxin domain-containing protein [Rhodospirillaceae bacterium]
MTEKLAAGAAMPEISLDKVGGGTVTIGGGRDGWQLIVVYRGRHCPICKRYLTGLKDLIDGYAQANTTVVAISADPQEKADAFMAEIQPNFPVGYGLSVPDMRRLGLYVSNPRSPQETDRPFAEPGLIVINPQGQAQIVDFSNAPFARPDLAAILNGIKIVQERGYPVRGTA